MDKEKLSLDKDEIGLAQEWYQKAKCRWKLTGADLVLYQKMRKFLKY